jgi:uncharacterized protein (TIGR03032 family)
MSQAEAATETPAPHRTAVSYEHTPSFVEVLRRLQVSLVVSTYQAGRLVVLGTYQGALSFSFHAFEQVMGVAVHPRRLAVGSKRQIWILPAARDLAPRVEPLGKYDTCYLTRTSHVTGEIHGHELAWAGDELWVVNTLFSCLCTLDPEYSFVPRWRPPFITALAAEDRCHLNGMILENGKPRYVTALSETDTPAGWRPTKTTSGCVLDVPSGEVIARGLCMPHSPRLYDGQLLVLNSGLGHLSVVELMGGRIQTLAELPGYTRGLALHGPYAFVGLSRIRETSVFGGVPIAEKREQLQCGVAVVDLRSGQTIASLRFGSGVEEIFSVAVLPGVRCPLVSGHSPQADEGQTLWLVPGQGP